MSEYFLKHSLAEMRKHNDGNWPIHWVAIKGLEEPIQSLGNNLIGCEIGSCYGWSLVYLLENTSNISKIYAVDPYIEYNASPGGGTFMSQETQNRIRELWFENTVDYSDKVELIQKNSIEAAQHFKDDSLDFVFIDGDHSHSAVKKDLATYYPKVKSGGIVAGHDYSCSSVKNALKDFFKKSLLDESILKTGYNDAWYFYK